MFFQEIIFCATAPPSAATGQGAIVIHDIQTGSALANFKQTSATSHCSALIETRDGQGGFVLAAQPDKSVMNVYNFQKDQVALKMVLPEKLSCVAVDPRGDFCAGGTAQGRIYLWEIASGILYNSWDAHYRQVNVLRFTHDCAALISGSQDSGVIVWSLSRLLEDEIQNELPVPYCTLSDHTLPITDIIIGVGLFPTCRVLTASLDHSVKIWDLSSKSLLTTFQFPNSIDSLAWDVTERMFFAASSSSITEGSIHQVNLFRQRDNKLGSSVPEAVGGAGVGDVIHVDDDDHIVNKNRLISVGLPITCLTLSLPSSLLLVGTSTGIINIYDTASHQHLRTISTHKGFTITHLSTMLKPPDLIGHVSLNISFSSGVDMKDVVPLRAIAPFQRTRDAKAREKHEVEMMLPIQDSTYVEDVYSMEELLQDQAYFIQPQQSASFSSSQASNPSLQTKVTALESEVAQLKEQLGKAKSLNDAMWENVVQEVIKGNVTKAVGSDGGGEDEGGTRRKRGRIE